MERLVGKKEKKRNILITGATGFLGSHLTEKLVQEGHKVIILKRDFSNIWRIKSFFHKLIVYDIDKIDLSKIFYNHKIDIIIHTATLYGRKGENFTELLKANLLFPVELIEKAINSGVKVFINTDTFFNKGKVNYKYLQEYTLTKRCFVEWLKSIANKVDMRIFNLKLEHIYGEKDSIDKFVPWLIIQMLKEVHEIKLSPGNQKRDFIYVKDVVDAYYQLLLKAETFNYNFYEYSIGTGKSITIKQFVCLVKKLTGNTKTILNFGALPYRENEIMFSKADITSIKKDIGWEPKYSLEEGLKRTIEWFKVYIRNGEII